MAGNVTYTISYVISGQNKLGTATRQAEADARRMSTSVQQSVREMGATSRRTTKAMRSSFSELAGAYNALVVARHAARYVAGAVKPAVDLQVAQTNLGIATGATAAQIDKMSKAAMEAALVTPFTPTQSMEAMQGLNLAIRDVDATTKALLPTLMLANTYLGRDTVRATKDASIILSGFRMQAGELSTALDKMVGAGRAVGVQVKEMDQGLKNLAVAAQAAGANYDDMMGLFALSVKGFRDASAAATALRTTFAALSDVKKRGILEDALGVSLVEDGRVKGPLEMIHLLAQAAAQHNIKWGAATDRWAEFTDVLIKAFGKRAFMAVSSAITSINEGLTDQEGRIHRGADAISYLQQSMADATGTLASAAEKRLGTMGGQLEVLRDTFTATMAATLEYVPLIIGPIVGIIAKLLGAIQQLLNNTGLLGKALKGLITLVALGGTAFLAAKVAGWALYGVKALLANATTWLARQQTMQTRATWLSVAAINAETLAINRNVAAKTTVGAGSLLGSAAASAMFPKMGAAGSLLNTIGGYIWSAVSTVVNGIKKAGAALSSALEGTSGKLAQLGVGASLIITALLAAWEDIKQKVALIQGMMMERHAAMQKMIDVLRDSEERRHKLWRLEFEANTEAVRELFLGSKDLRETARILSGKKPAKIPSISAPAMVSMIKGARTLENMAMTEQGKAMWREHGTKLQKLLNDMRKGVAGPKDIAAALMPIRHISMALRAKRIGDPEQVLKNEEKLTENLFLLSQVSRELYAVMTTGGLAKRPEAYIHKTVAEARRADWARAKSEARAAFSAATYKSQADYFPMGPEGFQSRTMQSFIKPPEKWRYEDIEAKMGRELTKRELEEGYRTGAFEEPKPGGVAPLTTPVAPTGAGFKPNAAVVSAIEKAATYQRGILDEVKRFGRVFGQAMDDSLAKHREQSIHLPALPSPGDIP